MGKTQKSVKEFALIGFVLLAVLFGMQIMTFIFGNLSATDYLDDVTRTTTNESGAYINTTGYTLTKASLSDFSGGAVITIVHNASDGVVITSGNYTINSATGVVTNATATTWEDVNITYNTNHKTEAEMVSDETSNESLHAIADYAGQSGTQFTTLGIAITLILLVAVFLFFWKSFMGKGEGKGGPGTFG